MASKETEAEGSTSADSTEESMVSETADAKTKDTEPTCSTDITNNASSSQDSIQPSAETQTSSQQIDEESPPQQTDKGPDTGGGDMEADAQTENCDSVVETVSFKVIYNKQKYDVTFPLDKTIGQLKDHVQTLTGVPSRMQKIMFKGLAKDEMTLRDLKVTANAKVMVVGSTMNDVLQVTATPSVKQLQEEEKAALSKEPLSEQKQHKKVLDKYKKPDDVMPGVKNDKQSLPPFPLSGMYNKSGNKVRLTFKLELDQVWLGTKERTEKIPMNSIKAVVSEAIAGNEDYHLMALQLGPTEASRYWIYWLPAQYTDAIKDTILGKWQFF